ncbi:MAG TPA: hypothetical protein VHV27_05010 [Phenylobacterium sp.]|jgi:hypothetical protein|nr:hypothetical protein [Phenylobacterium sp.]
MAYSHDRPRVDATRARQGRMGRSVFWVLVFGILLTVVGFAATWAWRAGDFAGATPEHANKAAASGYNAPRPDAASRQNYQKGAPLAPRNGGNPS